MHIYVTLVIISFVGDGKDAYIKFNTSTLHRLCYISDDSRTLSNMYTIKTPNSPDGSFMTYKGVSADICIQKR